MPARGSLKPGLALDIGFVRMAWRPLNSIRVVPGVLLFHLWRELGIAAPDLASLRALYARGRTSGLPAQGAVAVGTDARSGNM